LTEKVGNVYDDEADYAAQDDDQGVVFCSLVGGREDGVVGFFVFGGAVSGYYENGYAEAKYYVEEYYTTQRRPPIIIDQKEGRPLPRVAQRTIIFQGGKILQV